MPLHQVKRNGSGEMQLILKDVYRPRAEGSDVGFLKLRIDVRGGWLGGLVLFWRFGKVR